MTAGLRLGILKPDWGVVGGFELHVEALARRLTERGHSVEVVGVDAVTRPPAVYGMPVEPVFREWHDEYFRFLEQAERTQRLALDRFDVVCATQPPTYVARHPRLFMLGYHQYRIFYDLADEYVRAGFVGARAHAAATEAVRRIDAEAIQRCAGFLTGSDTIARRFEKFWNVGSVPYRHPNVTELPPPATRDRSGADVLCVSRQEWPKRTELFVAAMHLAAAHRTGTTIRGHMVGGGSRELYVRSLDAELEEDPSRLEAMTDADTAGILWRNRGIYTSGWSPIDAPPSGRVRFHGRVDDEQRNHLFRRASIVVAPALDEDYGLTVLEAWHQRRPVIVCRDGGGLAELVTSGESGLIVEPTPFAIAQAIDRLANDPTLADRLVEGGADALAAIEWSDAIDAFEAVMTSAAGLANRAD